MNRQMGLGRGKERPARRRSKEKIITVSADRADYKEMFPGVSIAVLWGDPEADAHGAFTRFQPGFNAGTHTHTSDVWIVVLKGAYLYRDDSGEKRIGPGDFLRIPGGYQHWSGGDEKDGALFYQEAAGKFDLLPVG